MVIDAGSSIAAIRAVEPWTIPLPGGGLLYRFRPEQAWAGIHRGAQVRTPRGFRWVLTSVTPLYALVWCAVWAMPYSPAVLAVAGVPAGDVPWRWGARLLLLVLLGVVCFAVYKACRPGAAPGGDT